MSGKVESTFSSGIAKNQKPLRNEAGAAVCSAGSP
jgi:hypothetical protein